MILRYNYYLFFLLIEHMDINHLPRPVLCSPSIRLRCGYVYSPSHFNGIQHRVWSGLYKMDIFFQTNTYLILLNTNLFIDPLRHSFIHKYRNKRVTMNSKRQYFSRPILFISLIMRGSKIFKKIESVRNCPCFFFSL